MKLSLVVASGAPCPVFDCEGPAAALRSGFLRDTQTCVETVISLIQYARHHSAGEPPEHWGGNEIWVDFYPDRAVITHQWISTPEGADAEITISLDEAESLLRSWQAELKAWEAKHSQAR